MAKLTTDSTVGTSSSSSTNPLVSIIDRRLDTTQFREQHWEGSFWEYLDIVMETPAVARNAFQRVYDMILTYGADNYTQFKQELTKYKFFGDPVDGGADAIFGLERPLMQLVDFFKSAAQGYGTEKRILLLHGPVGSSKSTMARLLKKGLESYSRTDAGKTFTYSWKLPAHLAGGNGTEDTGAADVVLDCPMHEEPLLLIPIEARRDVLAAINEKLPDGRKIRLYGDVCPFCRKIQGDLMTLYNGDWRQVIEHVRVSRLVLSEKDRRGIGTFQPKDEKNQDSTELTGDINYRKIAEYGSDSDPRAFSFDGELNIANRGIVEFIEVLKLDVAFLYDLLGASQEHMIKPKKFAQTYIDEVILGHSVAGGTPIPFRHDGTPGWATMTALHQRFGDDTRGLEVLAHDFATGATEWTPVKRVFRHRFTGTMMATSQKWGAVETTPNHSIYGRDGAAFYPADRHEIMAVRKLGGAFAAERPTDVIDVLAGVAGFVRDEVGVTAVGGRMTRPCEPGWARLDLPRHSTAVRAVYDPIVDVEPLKDLITVLVWYATEGHVNGRNGGIVITQANPAELERVRAAYARITTGTGSIDAGAKTDSAWRLYCGSQAIARVVEHHCGRLSPNKRLPDFLFSLPTAYLQHAFDELMRTDGSRKLSTELNATASEKYRAAFFEYKTISPMLAAQVGTLATLLGHDYGVYRGERAGKLPSYRVRFCSGGGKRGGRHTTFQSRLHERPAAADENGLGEWVYDIECIGLHNFVCGVGNVVASNTNEPEYKKLQGNEMMEAFRDRTIKIDVPYNIRLDDEVRIYNKDFGTERIKGMHVAPHTVEVAAMWAVLTRLAEPKKAGITKMQKLKLYNGKSIPGFTEDSIKELKEEAPREGMQGISPRYIQDKISNALVSHQAQTEKAINPFMVMNELEEGLNHHSLITDEELKKDYKELLATVREEYEDILKGEVQRAISADEDAIKRLATNYIESVRAYTQHERVRNRYTGRDEDPDERLMRSIEEKIDIPDSRKDDFRQEIMNYIGALALDGKRFEYNTNARLLKALELKLFEDQRDTIKLKNLVSSVVDDETQQKIDVVKQRLIKYFGYNETSATDVLNYVASIFARGDTKQDD